jgi:2-polyprenyl-3-methyl-5-hydroxy-6-metoxy-1,4-benzoquinol methylase
VYEGVVPWDVGHPQPAFRSLADRGSITGRVLDVGCGTGEHVLLAAELGLSATGIDIVPLAIEIALRKAQERRLSARFLVADALELEAFGETFDVVLDCGLFHVLDDSHRDSFVRSLRSAVVPGGRYFMLCFSDLQPGDSGPRRVRRAEIESSFASGWEVDSIEPATIEVTISPSGARAWLSSMVRT